MPEINSFVGGLLGSNAGGSASVLNGGGAPLPATGTTGSMYLDRSVPAYYGPKDATSGWPVNGLPFGLASPLFVPAGAAGIYSVRRLYTWNGLCCRVVRASDSATLDVSFSGNVADYMTVQAWAGGSDVAVSIWYDQSGNARDLIQTTAASRPLFYSTKLYGRDPSIQFDGTSSFLSIPSTIVADRANVSVWMVGRFYQHGGPTQGYWGFGQTANSPDLGLMAYINAFALQPAFGATRLSSGSPRHIPSVTKCVSGLNSSASGLGLYRDSYSTTLSALTAATLNTGGAVGRFAVGDAQARMDLETFIVYPTALSAPNVTAIQSNLSSTFKTNVAPKRIIMTHGDSIMFGVAANMYLRTYAGILSDYFEADTSIGSLGVSGRTLNGDLALRPTMFDPMIVSGAENNLFLQFGTNDLGAGRTAAQLYADVTTYVSGNGSTIPSAASAGWNKVIVSTVLPRSDGGWTGAMETARLSYNDMLRNSNLPLAVFDAASDAVMGGTASTNTALYPDALHPSALGYTYLSSALAAFIKNGAVSVAPVAPTITWLTQPTSGTTGTAMTVAVNTTQLTTVNFQMLDTVGASLGSSIPATVSGGTASTSITRPAVGTGYKIAASGTGATTAQSATFNSIAVPVGGTMTWSATDHSTDFVLSNGNLSISTGQGLARGSAPVASKAYWEVKADLLGSNRILIGIVNAASPVTAYVGSDANGAGFWAAGGILVNGAYFGGSNSWVGYVQGDVIGVALDPTAKLVWFRINAGNWNSNASANPATGTGGVDYSGTAFGSGAIYAAFGATGGGQAITANFGATAFTFTAPSGFAAP